MFRRIPIFVALISFALPQILRADEIHNKTNYVATLAGVPVAHLDFQVKQDGQAYKIEGRGASTAVVKMVATATAKISSSGIIKNGRWEPVNFDLRYKYRKRARHFNAAFNGGQVIKSEAEPAPRRKTWIDVVPQDLLGVTDPLAGIVMPANADPCARQIAAYDGESRFDLKLERKGQNTFKTEGFSGPVTVCTLHYEPKSGYRKNDKTIAYVRKLAGMEIWFAKSSKLNIYAPVYLSVSTSFGPLTIRATHFD